MPIPSDEGIPSLWGLLADPGGEIIAMVREARDMRDRRDGRRLEVFGTANPEVRIAPFSLVPPVLPVSRVQNKEARHDDSTTC